MGGSSSCRLAQFYQTGSACITPILPCPSRTCGLVHLLGRGIRLPTLLLLSRLALVTVIPPSSVTSKCDSAFLPMNGIDNCPSLLPAKEIDGSYLHGAFLRTAARDPGLLAILLDDGEAVTYGQLNARSDRLAHRLQQAGATAESVVGIALGPGVEMAMALLAVLKSGGAYLPLDPTAPLDRSCMILQDAGAVLVLGAGSSPWCEEALPCDYLNIEMDSADTGTSPVEMNLDPRNLAYVIYTSGSTGRPKGVMVPHESITAVFEWRRRAFPFTPGDRVLQTLSYTFDASLWEFFHTLGSGAALVFLTPFCTHQHNCPAFARPCYPGLHCYYAGLRLLHAICRRMPSLTAFTVWVAARLSGCSLFDARLDGVHFRYGLSVQKMPRLRIQPHGLFPGISFGREPSKQIRPAGLSPAWFQDSPAHTRPMIAQASPSSNRTCGFPERPPGM